MEIVYVNTVEALMRVCQRLRQAPAIAVDTEFLREKTYYAQLCLIQLACEDMIVCVDPLQMDSIEPILDVIYDPGITKIFHSARQDLEVLFDIRHALPSNVFDTQVAATFLNQGDQIGYAALVNALLGVELAKTQTRTDWSKRPLTNQQLEYACDDVRYLIPLYHQQMAALKQLGRVDWAEEDFLSLSDAGLLEKPRDSLWQRVRNWQGLTGQQLAVLQVLSSWREDVAIAENRPRRWVIGDTILVELARQQPMDTVSLEALASSMSAEKITQRYESALLLAISEGRRVPEVDWPQAKSRSDYTPAQLAEIKAFMSLVKVKADACQLTSSLISTRKDIENIVSGGRNNRLLDGWRYHVVGVELLNILNENKKLKATESVTSDNK